MSEVMNLDIVGIQLDKSARAVLKSHEVRAQLSTSEDLFAEKTAGKVTDFLRGLSHFR